MKTRRGFVSNSSSSSFIVGIKDDLRFSNGLYREALVDVMGVPVSSALYKLAGRVADFIIDAAEKVDLEEFLDDHNYKTLEDAVADGCDVAQMINAGWRVFRGSASYNESDNPIELMIGIGGLTDIDTGNFVFILDAY